MGRRRVPLINPGKRLRLRLSPAAILRLLRKVRVCPRSGCWLWSGCADANGYGKCKVLGRTQWAPRVFYAVFRGTLPAGREVDHRCHNPPCVNPWHLRRKTPLANAVDGGRWRHRASTAKDAKGAKEEIPF